tara:strand:- start:220 stop:396 length:177 start_codon:yes stop_codon:yes gene_type:complete
LAFILLFQTSLHDRKVVLNDGREKEEGGEGGDNGKEGDGVQMTIGCHLSPFHFVFDNR